MKNKMIFIPFVSLAIITLAGCTNDNAKLTFGTYIPQSLDSLVVLDSSDLFDKTQYSNESFILATYQGKESESCLCWNTFQNVIVNYMNKHHEKVYLYDMDNYDDLQIDLKLEKYKDSTPALYVFEGKKQLAKFTYKKSKDKSIFSDLETETMYERIHKVIKKPSLFEVNDDYLSNNLDKNIETIALFIRSSCPDCTYSLSDVIIPYINLNVINKEIWVFDLEDYYRESLVSSTVEGSNSYQNIKNKYGLSQTSSQRFGYGDGFVPTIQYYINGMLKDSSVFFNDKVSQKEDGSYYISDSFYTNERLTYLKYAKNVENNVLKDMELSEEDVIKTNSGYTYWLQEKAAVYHTPLLEAFLDYYCR